MKKASKIMFSIGRIFNIIAIPLSVIFMFIGGMLLVTFIISVFGPGPDSVYGDSAFEPTDSEIISCIFGFVLIFVSLFLLIFSIISLIVCSKKHSQIESGSKETAPRIFLIVFGFLGDNIFYILSGIFSLVARSQEPSDIVIETEL